ncbi:RAD52 motif-containing protein 1-like isoform X1 [Balaenoptera acutorostrata]|uniref:RAD52 motif-containing protein 1 n=1 Tax=Balaenoptera acutorostrata TaxID=9767 RepID=A0ABM3SRY5_BALAC|nr:RAD52 motif-containing protein 1-like isoform X1 [Balaenoptera acutorostrata]XP_057392609.1 RAD52 motif-containing protein 1-like isoform X1 [Balaenoptera acutorostrata]
MVVLVPFVVPIVGDKTLLVWELSCGPTAEALQHSLFTVFSQFGLLYSVRVFPNAAVAGPVFYAIIEVYSARDAHRAQKACDQKQLFQTSPVKVRLGTRHKAVQHNTLAPNSSRCQELANYYFGFNGWSKRIIKRWCCPPTSAGVLELAWLRKEPLGSLSFLMKRKVTQKLAIQKAMTDAFQKLLIVVLESGKIAVAYRPCEEVTDDARTEEELQDLIQVSYFSCQPCGQRGEECLSDLSFEEEEFTLPELD